MRSGVRSPVSGPKRPLRGARLLKSRWCRSALDRKAVAAGHWFDLAAAERVRTFFRRFLRHGKGTDWAGKPFELLPWQWQDVVAPIFGWKRPDGMRRFRQVYIEMGKKNGKSTLCAGLSLYLLVGDGEPGAEVYSAAMSREQAGIIYRDAAAMVRTSAGLSERVEVVDSRKTLAFPQANAFYRALSADVPATEGWNIHGLLFDELHRQKSRDLWDALIHGGIARRQPLMIAITTAGWDRHSICWEQHDYAEKVRQGIIEDLAFLGVIYAAREDEDWRKPAAWRRANPSLGTIVRLEEIAAACKEAQASPAKENNFKRRRLSLWTEQAVRWMPMDLWDRCAAPVDEAALVGRPCWGGLDLASTSDTASFVLVFPPVPGDLLWRVVPRFWVPGENAHRREERDRVPYVQWSRQGYITLTEGNVIDYERIKTDLGAAAARFGAMRDIGADRWNLEYMRQRLTAEGLELVAFGQGFASLSAPTKEVERLVRGGLLAHGGNPVLRWMASNVAVETDAAGNVKPAKDKSSEKIDGIVALVMAVGRAMAATGDKGSVYDRRGMIRV